MRRTLVALSLAIILIVASFGQSGADSQGVVVLVNGQPVSFDQPPVLTGGRVLVPLRGVFERLGASVGWDGKTEIVTAVRGNVQVVLRIGARQAFVNGQAVPLDVPPRIVGARTLVPLRFVSEALGANVDWSAVARIVSITTVEATQAPPPSQSPQPGQPSTGGPSEQPGAPPGPGPTQPASPLPVPVPSPQPGSPPTPGPSPQPGSPPTPGPGPQPGSPPTPGPGPQPSQPAGAPIPHIVIDRTVYHQVSTGVGAPPPAITSYEVDVSVSNSGAAGTFAVGMSLEPNYPTGYVGTVTDLCANLVHPYGNASSVSLPASSPPRVVLQVLGDRSGSWDSAPLSTYRLRAVIYDPTTATYANPYLGPAGGYTYTIQSKDETTVNLPSDGNTKCFFNPNGLSPGSTMGQQPGQGPQQSQPAGAKPTIKIDKTVHQRTSLNGPNPTTVYWVDVYVGNPSSVATIPFAATLNVYRGSLQNRVCTKGGTVNIPLSSSQSFLKILRFQVTLNAAPPQSGPLVPYLLYADIPGNPTSLGPGVATPGRSLSDDVATLNLPASGMAECVFQVPITTEKRLPQTNRLNLVDRGDEM